MQDREAERGRIGSTIAEARRRAGLTVADVAHQTKVSTRYLLAIERDELDKLPSRCHALGFARSFARAVRIDERMVCDHIRTRFDCDVAPSAREHSAPTRQDRHAKSNLFSAARMIFPI